MQNTHDHSWSVTAKCALQIHHYMPFTRLVIFIIYEYSPCNIITNSASYTSEMVIHKLSNAVKSYYIFVLAIVIPEQKKT